MRDLFGKTPEDYSLEIIREYEPPEGYHLAFSGGKDSVVLHELAVRSSVRFKAHYAFTGIDPPEVVAFIREHYPGVIFDRPECTFWRAIRENRGLPMRNSRWCCRELKEFSGEGRVLTGVRAAESRKRASYAVMQRCTRQPGRVLIHPILHWTTSQVWNYIHAENLPYCSLYDEGWTRIGCVFCPFESHMERARFRWPKLFNALAAAVRDAYPTQAGWQKFGSPEAVLEWWLDRSRSMSSGEDVCLPFDQFDEEDSSTDGGQAAEAAKGEQHGT